MAEHSAAAKESQRAEYDRFMSRQNSRSEISVNERNLSNSREFSERRNATRFDSAARIQDDAIGGNSCTESECERLNKYPDYCRTITIRGSAYFCIYFIMLPTLVCVVIRGNLVMENRHRLLRYTIRLD